MRFFASWWERFPAREAVSSVVVVLAVFGASAYLHLHLAGPAGWSWG